MFPYELRILIIDVATETSVKFNEAAFVAEVTQAVHDLLQPLFLSDMILQYLLYQHRVLCIGGIPKLTDSADDIPKFIHCVLVVIHLSVPFGE